MSRLVGIARRGHAAVAALPPLVQQRPVRSMLFVAVALGHITLEYLAQAVRRVLREALD